MDPILVTKVEKGPSDAPVLIVDRKGIIGNAIYDRIKKELLVVLVSGIQPESTENCIYIHYKNRIPEIPNDAYSLIVLISDQEKDIHALANECITKAKHDKVKFVFVTLRQHVNPQLIEKIQSSYENSYVLVLGELFGNTSDISQIDTFILQAATIGTIHLPFMGLRKTRPVLFDDAIHALLYSIFGIQQDHRIIHISQRHTYTDLSLAHILQKADPLVHVDFLKDGKKSAHMKALEEKEKKTAISGHYYFDDEYAVADKLTGVYKSLQTEKKSKVDAYVYKEEFKPILDLDSGNSFQIPNPLKIIGLYLLYCIIIVIGIPIAIFVLSLMSAHNAQITANAAMEKGDISTAIKQIGITHTSFAVADLIKYPILFELSTIGASNYSRQLDDQVTTGKEISDALQNLLSSYAVFQKVISGNSQHPDVDIANAVSLDRSSLVTLQKTTTTDTTQKEIIQQVENFQNEIHILTGTANMLPQILGVNGQKTYLVLFTDNTDIRPGGGLIQVYGLLQFDHGRMSNMLVHNVSDADSKLRQHVDPPFAINRFMGIQHLYLRDSNFDVDFVKDAQKSSYMLQLATDQHVDGVISLDMTAVQYLLSALGPVSISQFGTTADADNLSILAEDYAEKGHNTDFLKDVFTAVEEKLLLQRNNTGAVVEKIVQAIEEKHLMIALADITSQNTLTANHLSSSLWDPRLEGSGIINDFMGISEANIGVNSVGYFLKRNIKQSVSIDGDGVLKGEADIQYQNASPSNQFPGGEYKNYIQIILPQDTQLTNIAIDGRNQATRSAITDPYIYQTPGFKPPSEIEVEKSEEFGKVIYGFPVAIPISTTKMISISYEHTKKINLSNPVLHYNLLLYKQPGVNGDPFSFTFNYPLEYSILSSNPVDTISSDSDYLTNFPFGADKTISVDLTKK